MDRADTHDAEAFAVTPDPATGAGSPEHLVRLLARARGRGVNPLVLAVVRMLFHPFFRVYFRMERIGREHIPATGPVILASNHRSFLDPFVIGCLTRRPVYYVAKKELFRNPAVAWFLSSLGAFPIDRKGGDVDAMAAARAILERGQVVVIFPEGTRIRRGPLAQAHRGVGRLALETGACVVPVAVIGTQDVRRGWRIRPRHVRLRVGRPLAFPHVEQPSRQLAGAVTERIWACVRLQWAWLGGALPEREARSERPPELTGRESNTHPGPGAVAAVGASRAA
jgi:1-acyl-sn-glycerol-3-phosphate acyltransferase